MPLNTDYLRTRDQLRRQNDYLAALHQISLDLLNHHDLDELLQKIVDQAAQLLDAPYSEIMLVDGNELVVRAFTSNQPFLSRERLQMGEAQLSSQAVVTRRPAVVDDYATWPGRRALYDPLNVRAVAAIPILSGETCLGVFDLSRSEPDYPFDEEQIWIATALAQLAAVGIENARLYSAMRTELEERRRAEHELQNQRDFALQIMQSMGQGLVVTGPDGRYEYVNPAAASIVGVEPEETIGKSARDFTFPEDYDKLAEAAAARLRGETVTYDIRLRGRHSNEVYALVTSAPRRTANNEYAGSIAVITDLTERRRLERAMADERTRLQALIEASRDGIVMIGRDGLVRVVNAPALRLLNLPGETGYWLEKPAEEMVRRMRRLAPAAARATLAERRRLARGDDSPAEGRFESPPFWIEWLSLPVMRDAASLGRLLVLRDITQERLTAQLRDDLTHTMVHDLRNPATAIIAALELMEMELGPSLSADGNQLLAMARQSGENMLNLVSAILDISRLENKQMPVERSLMALAVVVKEAINLLAPVAISKGLRLESKVPLTLPFAWASHSLVSRVLQNLIGNALKYTPPNGLIHVTARLDEAGSDWLAVSVTNTGPGIAPELKSRLFQKFAAGRDKASGSGLGLAFCRLVVEAHGGRIWVESEPGKETVFTFTLPAAAEQ